MNDSYRFSFDMGTNSIGWCVYKLDKFYNPCKIEAVGSRIYSDGRVPDTGASLAVDRRNARSARRQRDRFLSRKKALMKDLVRFGLMPLTLDERRALEGLNPYQLRAKALDEKLPAFHIGRVIFHLNQRRGFKSNRKTDQRDNEAGEVKLGVKRLDIAMQAAGARTYGEFLNKLNIDDKPVRNRRRAEINEKGRSVYGYDVYPSRAHLEKEFDTILEKQRSFYPDLLSDGVIARLRSVIFYQRPLKPQKVGKCVLLPDEERIAKAHPLFQKRRLLEELNSLRIERTGEKSRPLTLDERNKLFLYLSNKKEVPFKSLAKKINLSETERFNKHSDTREKIKGNEINKLFSAKAIFGARWYGFSDERQWEIISHILHEQNPEALHDYLTLDCDLGDEQAHAAAMLNVPDGYSNLGQTAEKALVREYETAVIVYSEAVRRSPELGHHSDFRDGEIYDELPYYGHILSRHIPTGTGDPKDEEDTRVGKITNPTVHIGLNQLKRVTNALIRKYGAPHSIIIELARDLKLNKKQKEFAENLLKKNTKASQARSKKLEEIGVADNGRNRLLLRLWEELNPENPLDRRCPYTGNIISVNMLFTNDIDVDHIIPFSKCFDDSAANKVVCMAEANKRKSNKTPYEAFYGTDYWPAIEQCVANLPRNKAWRFNSDALERYNDQGGFLARQLTDTQYVSKMARQYLEAVCPTQSSLLHSGVSVVPGKLTEMLRRHWDLNRLLNDHNHAGAKKNRADHRHHAIDAAVIGVTDRGLLQRISKVVSSNEENEVERVISDIKPPFAEFRGQLGDAVNTAIVSHKADRGKPGKNGSTTGKLHKETAYGLAAKKSDDKLPTVVHKIEVEKLRKTKDIEKICNEHLQSALLNVVEDLSEKDFPVAISHFIQKQTDENGPYANMRGVRVCQALSVIEIKDETGKTIKAYAGNANQRFDVWELPDGKWKANVISVFDAHRKNYDPDAAFRKEHSLPPTARKVLRLHQNDMIAYDDPEKGTLIARVVKFTITGQITLVAHNEANIYDRHNEKSDPFKLYSPTAFGLKKLNARQVRVDEIGQLFDPGPITPAKTSKKTS